MDSSTSGQPPEATRAETMEVDPQQGPALPPKSAKKETPMHYKAKIKVFPDDSDNATEFLPEDLEYLNDCCETELADNEDEMLLGKILDFAIHLGVGSILCENYGTASKLVQLLNGLYNNGRTRPYTVYNRASRQARAPSGGAPPRAGRWATTSSRYVKKDEIITPKSKGGGKSLRARSPKIKHKNGRDSANSGLFIF